jgi:lipoprotein-releasing system permease protein|tara:strand:+ start:69 stop:1304 length:1236 start_codon:yes stop_codon:yes gene_type:complete
MNLSLFIAKRYFFSKKKSFINFLSITAFIGVMVGTSSLIIVLSVFNGLEDLLKSLYINFNPEIKIVSNNSKYFIQNNDQINNINNIEGVDFVSKVIEDRAIASYNGIEIPVYIKGADSSFSFQNRLNKNIVEGDFILKKNSSSYAVVGRGVKYKISLNLNDNFNNLILYSVSPNFSFIPSGIQKKPFNQMSIIPSGVFAIEQQIDNNFIISSLAFVEKLFEKKNKITALELKINEKQDVYKIKSDIKNIVGDDYNVLTIEEQHSDLYKILKTEKLIVFIIFSFILIISSFNIFFLLSMHAIDKKRDLSILLSLGFTEKSIKKIFYYESMIISILGIVIGGALGVLLCVLQNEYGLVSLGMETAIIKYYPVKVKLSDILIIVSIVFFISIIASIKPSLIAIQKINLNLLNNK